MKVTSLRYLDAKFHHFSLGASPPNRGNRISCVQNSRKTENRNSVNNSGICILCSKNSNERLAVPAVAGLLVIKYRNVTDRQTELLSISRVSVLTRDKNQRKRQNLHAQYTHKSKLRRKGIGMGAVGVWENRLKTWL